MTAAFYLCRATQTPYRDTTEGTIWRQRQRQRAASNALKFAESRQSRITRTGSKHDVPVFLGCAKIKCPVVICEDDLNRVSRIPTAHHIPLLT